MKHIVYLFVIIVLSACTIDKYDQLERSLKLAGDNRLELERVLEHYKDDTLKLKAVYYLIKNMPYHFTKDEYYIMPDGKRYRPDGCVYNTPDRMARHCNTLLIQGCYITSENRPDLKSVKADFLINNVDAAFKVWKKPWARNISFDDFCQYILPYRAQVEELSCLRRKLMELYVPLLDLAGVATPSEACMVLNDILHDVYHYKVTGCPLYPTIEETLQMGISECDGLCNIGIFIMRAAGVPVTMDQTLWTRMARGHCWCVLCDGDKRLSFDLGGGNIDNHARRLISTRYLKPVKVYRSRFNPYLPTLLEKDDGYKTFLKNPLYLDVTDEYLAPTHDLKISTIKSGKNSMVYLCALNSFRWQPLALGSRCKDSCSFKSVVGDDFFIAADSPDGENLRFITTPFYVDSTGHVKYLDADIKNARIYSLDTTKMKVSNLYSLYYWDCASDSFRQLNKMQSADTCRTYSTVPSDALMVFYNKITRDQQRVFMIIGDSIKQY